MKKIINKLKKKFGNKNSDFIKNLAWLGMSAGVNRFTRLLTTVVLARVLSEYDYGLAAIVITNNEFIKVFTRNGIGVRLIQAPEKEVESLAQSAYWLNWVLFTGLFILQCLISFPLAAFYNDSQLIIPFCAMGLGLLLLPHGLVQAALIQRENRFKIISLVQVLQVSTDNILSLIFCLIIALSPLNQIEGIGMWAIVLPKIIVAPIWLIIMLKNHSWRPKWKFTTNNWGELLTFGRNVLGVELLNTLRSNLDYLIVGKFLSIEALGVYFFAFNAGLGISLGILTSIKSALLPHFCDARDNLSQFKKRYFNSLKTIGYIIVPLVSLQSALAPIYVPIVFGEKWINAVPIIIIICLSAIPRPFADSASQLLISVDSSEKDLYWNIFFTAIFAIGLSIGVHWQALGVAISVLITHVIFMPLFTIWASKNVFNKLNLKPS